MVLSMRGMGRYAWLIVVSGCGRLGFDAGVATGDARRDGPSSDVFDAPGGASTCPIAGVIVCDGFESASLDPRWVLSLQSGSATLEQTRAYRGTWSMHFHTEPVNAGSRGVATIRTKQGALGPVTGMIYARAWAFYVLPHPETVFDQAVNFVDATFEGVAMGWRDGFVRSNDYHFQQSTISAVKKLPFDRWVCLQLEVPSNIEGTTRVYVDGVEATDVALTTPAGMPQPAADHIYFGLDWITTTAALPTTDAWFDELIVSAAPTTCEQ
jgi:hypothetical protein